MTFSPSATAATSSARVSWPLYSADDHLDLWSLPADLWSSRLPRALRDAGPNIEDRGGVPKWVAEGNVLGGWGTPTAKGQNALARIGLEADGLRPSDPVKRLSDMDRDGVWASVIYGPSTAGLRVNDPQLHAACCRAWNDYTAEFNAHAPGRLAALPIIPTCDPATAAAELVRAAELGHRGALVFCFDFDCGDPAWDRLWAAAQDTGLPLSFHIGGGVRFPAEFGTWRTMAFPAVVALEMAYPLVSVLLSGALERHPGFTLVLAESGLGWVPYLMNRLDMMAARWAHDLGAAALKVKPTNLLGSQLKFTFEEEVNGADFLRMLPEGTCMWASDYPHPDSTFPHSIETIAESLDGLDRDACRVITADTCRALYRFDQP